MAEAKERQDRRTNLPSPNILSFYYRVRNGNLIEGELRDIIEKEYPPLTAVPATEDEHKRIVRFPEFNPNHLTFKLGVFPLGHHGMFNTSDVAEQREIQALKTYARHCGVRPAGSEERVPISGLVQSDVVYPHTGVFSGQVAIFVQVDPTAVQTSTFLSPRR